MNEQEKKAFYIATCKCCMLADGMKNCSACLFNAGLAEQGEPILFEPDALPLALALFTFPDQQQLERV